MFGVIMPLCNRMFCCIFGWYFFIKIRLKMKKIFYCPALELFCCLPLWKTVLFVSSGAFSLSTSMDNSEATWKKATKCNKLRCFRHNMLTDWVWGMEWTWKKLRKQEALVPTSTLLFHQQANTITLPQWSDIDNFIRKFIVLLKVS